VSLNVCSCERLSMRLIPMCPAICIAHPMRGICAPRPSASAPRLVELCEGSVKPLLWLKRRVERTLSSTHARKMRQVVRKLAVGM
jgi:hypothetical protein